jgi:Tol biopolymer transport system component
MRWLVLGACVVGAAALAGSSSPSPPRALLSYSISYRSLGATGPPTGRLCLAHADGSHAVRLLSKGDYRESAWSPGGRYVAYSLQMTGNARPAIFEIFLANARGRLVRNLSRAHSSFNLSPAWSPDGRQLVYIGAWRGSEVLLVSRKGGESVHLAFDGSDPAWLPDGSRIAFSDPDGISSIRPDGSDYRLMIPTGAQPDFKRDGSKVAYIKSTEGDDNTDVFVSNLDGSDERRLTTTPVGEYGPAWSPDGRLIAFERRVAATDRSTVVVIRADTGAEVTTIRGPYNAFDPSWRSPVNLPRAKRLPCR